MAIRLFIRTGEPRGLAGVGEGAQPRGGVSPEGANGRLVRPGTNGRSSAPDEPGSRRLIGQITEPQLRFLVDELEEEGPEDRGYYLDDGTLELLEEAGADPQLMQLLRQATTLGHPFRDAVDSEAPREGVEIVWESDEDIELS